jgi:uncharacterized protein (DUF1501 family)
MNRRDFLNQTLLGIMSSYLIGNPLLLGAQGNESAEANVVFLFLRGGSDQVLGGHTLKEEIVRHFNRLRGNFTIREDNSYPFKRDLAIPIDYDDDGDYFVLPNFWEGLFSRNLSGEIPADRIRAPRVRVEDEEVPLDHLFAVRIIQNACNMNFVGNLNFSHAVTQLAAVVMNTLFQFQPGTLARVINYWGSNSEHNSPRALYLGHAGFSSFEFGDVIIDATSNQNVRGLSTTRPLGSLGLYSPPIGACRGYHQASPYFRFNGDQFTNEYRTVKYYIDQLRPYTDSNLLRLYNDTYEQLREIEYHVDGLRNFRFSDDENAAFMVKRYNDNNQITLTQPRFNAFRQTAAYFLNNEDFPENIKFAGITIGGWDHHSNLRRGLLDLVPELVAGIGGLIYTIAKRAPRKLCRTFIYIFSEFGRTMRANGGGGTDHGNGNNVIVIIGICPFGRRNMWNGRKREFNKVLGPKLQYTESSLFRVPLDEYARLGVTLFNNEFILGKISQQAGLFALLFKLLNVPESRVLNDTTAPFIWLSHVSPHGRRLFNEVWQGLPQFES